MYKYIQKYMQQDRSLGPAVTEPGWAGPLLEAPERLGQGSAALPCCTVASDLSPAQAGKL